MENVRMEVNGSLLLISIDLAQTLRISESGKSEIIATTGGNVSLPSHDEIKVGVNVYRPRKHNGRG